MPSSSIAIGFSQAPDPQEAAYQAAMMVKSQLKSDAVDMVILFTSVHYAHKEVLEAIHTILQPAKLVGCSSAGIILTDAVFTRGLALMAINSTSINFGAGFTLHNPNQEFRQFGFELNRKFTLDYKSSFVKQASVVLSDGMLSYDNDFALGAQEIVGQTCPLIGGFSCDDFKFKKSFQFYQKQVASRSASGFLIGSSEHTVAFSCKHGFIPLGKPRSVTSVQGSVIRTIDHKPAVHLYEEFLQNDWGNLKKGFLQSPAVMYPLGLYLEQQRQYLIRYPVDILDDGSIVCQADVPSNTEVHLTINNKESCRAAATSAAQEIKQALEGRRPQFVIVFESIVRHKILGHQILSEIKAVKEVLGASTPIIGMYSFGELSRLGIGEGFTETFLQNGSLLLLAVG